MDLENKKEQVAKKDKGTFLSGLMVGILSTVVVTVIIAICVILGGKQSKVPSIKTNQSFGEIMAEGDFVDEEMLQKLSLIEDMIDVYFYKDDIDDTLLEEGVYRGVLDALEDPYTCYYSVEELNQLMEQTSGVYYGIGAYVSYDETGLYPMITKPMPGSPAEEADLRPGDIIYEIDGESTYGKNLDSAVAMIKGKEGSEVKLTIVRSTEKDFLYVSVVRRMVEAPSVEFEMLEDGMAYIQIADFTDVTATQFADALASARGSDMKGLIIDLRANPGGSLTAVVDVARMLLPKGLVVYTEDKYGQRSEYKCDGKREFDQPLVVLVDGNSASASEVLAGAIKDYELGVLVGTQTFGKGIVQKIYSLEDGSAVKMTVSNYYSPKGINIHGTGIAPDKECKFDAEAYYAEESVDNQLEYAKEVLREMIE